MTFAIISPTRVEVDGNDAGLLYDYIIANPGKASEIKAALVSWHASHVIAQQARDAEVVAAKAAKDAEVAAKEAAHAAAITAKDAEVAALNADLAVLGTKPEAVAMREAKALTEKIQKRAALAAEISKLDAELEPTDAKP